MPAEQEGSRHGDDGGGETQGRSESTAMPIADAAGIDRITVLHVDDEPDLLSVTEEYLAREDDRLDVETATNPREGLELLAERSFDVVVSDYQMPEMDGLDFLEAVRDRGLEVPFIIFTGRGREEVAVEALNLGADRYIQKGGDPSSQYGLLADAIAQETEHYRARRQLEESVDRYRTLVEAFPDVVFITDYDSHMLWANSALERQTGLTVEDFQMEQEENPFIYEEDAERVAAHIGAFVESDRKFSEPIDNRFVTPEGETEWYSSIIAKVTFGGEPALQFIVRNVTERKRRERRLEQASDRLDLTASVVSHDMRNPLEVISGRATLLAETGDSDHAEAIRRQTRKLNDLIENTITIAREGDPVDATEPTDVGDLAEGVWAALETDDASLSVDAPTIEAHPERTRQLLEQILENALEHGRDNDVPTTAEETAETAGGADELTVSVGTLADGFFVEDDGVGVDPNRQETVFEAGHSTTRGGSGLGLTIVRQFAQAHGWEVTLTESDEGGARVEIRGVDPV